MKDVLPLQGAPSYDDKKLHREHDMELVREESIDGSTAQLTLDMPLFSAYLIIIE